MGQRWLSNVALLPRCAVQERELGERATISARTSSHLSRFYSGLVGWCLKHIAARDKADENDAKLDAMK